MSGALGGYATGGSKGAAAERLDESAHYFSRELCAWPAPSHTAGDASHDRPRASFAYVAERYHQLRNKLGGRRYYESYGFERVTDAYLDVNRAMNHPRSRYE